MLKSGTGLLAALILSSLISGCARRQTPSVASQAPAAPDVARSWGTPFSPFRAENIIALGNVFWICGHDEMIASSSDGGNTWKVTHQNRGGGTLLNIAFVSDRVGHAAGVGGQLLSTTDGGETWQGHNAGGNVWMFSFADANNGIAVIGGHRSTASSIWTDVPLMSGVVKLTNDGGAHWEEIPALASDELRPYTLVLAVAALDPSNYLMIRRRPEVEDVYLVTADGGKSWKVVHQRNDATNRELASWVFVHGGEYWVFGMELVHRDTGGGYGVPLTLRSKSGETWTHGINGGLHEFGSCNSQGCLTSVGTVEMMQRDREQYWTPPPGSLSSPAKWAIAGNRACIISTHFECGPAIIAAPPQQRTQAQ
jgi:hypothetical protein